MPCFSLCEHVFRYFLTHFRTKCKTGKESENDLLSYMEKNKKEFFSKFPLNLSPKDVKSSLTDKQEIHPKKVVRFGEECLALKKFHISTPVTNVKAAGSADTGASWYRFMVVWKCTQWSRAGTMACAFSVLLLFGVRVWRYKHTPRRPVTPSLLSAFHFA